MSTITEDEKTRISFAPTVSKNTVCNEVHKHHVKKSPEKIHSQDVNVYYPKGCRAPGFCFEGSSNHKPEDCKPASCAPCIRIAKIKSIKIEWPTCHDARNCPCVPYKPPNKRTENLKEKANNLYQCYVSSGKLSNQIEIENLNRENNIWSVSKTLPNPVNVRMKKVDVKDLFKPKLSYASVLSSTDDVCANTISTDSLSSEIVSSKVVSSKVVSLVDESLVDESDEVKSIRLLLLKFQNLERVLINTGNGTEEEFREINKCILFLTDKL